MQNGRFDKIAGLDYKRGAVEYTDKIGAHDLYHLLTKPFYNLAHRHARYDGAGLDADTHRHFCDFANLLMILGLPPGAKILDVGCGSGWLSEFLARFGYDATGLDISPALIEMARERVARLPYQVDRETAPRCRFIAQDIERAPLTETFDAIICYDSLHHFDDERAVMRHLAAMLENGGRLFIMEGERPTDDAPLADELRQVMQDYATLEAPFSRDYLLELLDTHGFAVIGDFVSVNGLWARDTIREGLLPIAPEPVNYILAKKVNAYGPASDVPDSRQPAHLAAEILMQGEWHEQVTPGQTLRLKFTVKNTGDTLWLVERAAPRGTVRLGCKVIDAQGVVVDEWHGAPSLPGAMAPGEQAALLLERGAPVQCSAYTLKIDLLDQEICWFEQVGTRPLALPFVVA